MKPSIGRIVHFCAEGHSQPLAALVTGISESSGDAGERVPCLSLCIFDPNGLTFERGVLEAALPTPGRWNWPPQVY